MSSVFLLEHSYKIGKFTEIKIIGVYSSKEKAKIVVEKYKYLLGFKDYPEDCFHIDEYKIDEDRWAEGFIKLTDVD